jgi:hypothetical protein
MSILGTERWAVVHDNSERNGLGILGRLYDYPAIAGVQKAVFSIGQVRGKGDKSVSSIGRLSAVLYTDEVSLENMQHVVWVACWDNATEGDKIVTLLLSKFN